MSAPNNSGNDFSPGPEHPAEKCQAHSRLIKIRRRTQYGGTKDEWKPGPNLQYSRGDKHSNVYSDANPGTTRHPLNVLGDTCPPAGWPAALPDTPTQPLKWLTAAKESQAFSFTGWTAQAFDESSQSALGRARPALPGLLTVG